MCGWKSHPRVGAQVQIRYSTSVDGRNLLILNGYVWRRGWDSFPDELACFNDLGEIETARIRQIH